VKDLTRTNLEEDEGSILYYHRL